MLKFIKNSLMGLYLQYELVTCIYMFEPWEKKLINGFVMLILGLVVFSSCVYLPTYIETLLQFISPLSTATDATGSPSTPAYAPILQTQKMS